MSCTDWYFFFLVYLGVDNKKCYSITEGLKNKGEGLMFHIIYDLESFKFFKMENNIMKILMEWIWETTQEAMKASNQ